MNDTASGPGHLLPIAQVLARPAAAVHLVDVVDVVDAPNPLLVGQPAREIGRSRQGRPIHAWVLGRGRRRVSLVGGAHADEPVGPEMLGRLVGFLGELPADHPLLTGWTWYIVPHLNPDGAAVNAAWSNTLVELPAGGEGYDLAAYLEGAVREPPGDDVEFGYPRGPDDRGARPENRAVAELLAHGAPFALHGSFHSMAFAAGPWFLLDRAWIGRTAELRQRLTEAVERAGYRLHDVDRRGEKGFTRIGPGFTTRPDSRAMRQFFLDRNDPETAELFRPSSMELVRGLGGDPLTIVSEMPLFVVPAEPSPAPAAAGTSPPPLPLDPPSKNQFVLWARRTAREQGVRELRRRAALLGVHPMPIADQMRLQLAFLEQAMLAVLAAEDDLAVTT